MFLLPSISLVLAMATLFLSNQDFRPQMIKPCYKKCVNLIQRPRQPLLVVADPLIVYATDKLCCVDLSDSRTVLLGLKVPEWDGKELDPDKFRIIQDIKNSDVVVKEILQTTRLGIPPGRDEHLEYRFIDAEYVKYCTKNPLTVRKNPPKVTKL